MPLNRATKAGHKPMHRKEQTARGFQVLKPDHLTPRISRFRCSASGFTLVELIAVLAILSLLVVLLVPATAGLLGTTGRKGAANVLLGTFEQARAASIETSSPVYVYFWRRSLPQRDAFIVARMNRETGQPEFLTNWRTLPQGTILYDPRRTHWSGGNSSERVLSLLSIRLDNSEGLPPDVVEVAGLLPQQPDLSRVSALKFNEFGAIEHPLRNPLALFIGEGFRDDDGREVLVGPREEEAGGGIEKLAFSRFTGRASLEISVGN